MVPLRKNIGLRVYGDFWAYLQLVSQDSLLDFEEHNLQDSLPQRKTAMTLF